MTLLVSWHQPGCLPEMEPFEVDTAAEGWQAIVDDLDATRPDLMWEPDPDDGPDRRSPVARMLERKVELDCPSYCYIDGYNYVVEDLP